MKGFRIFTLFLIFTISSCDIINPEEEIPSYIEILPFDYTVGSDGSSSQKITDAWIYVNGEYLGAFDLPKTIPVLAIGDHDVIIDPGIKENGIKATPIIYPFYERFNGSINLVPGEVTSIQPATKYDEDRISILLNEGFNNSSNVNTFGENVEHTDVDVMEGARSGLILLDKETMPNVGLKSTGLTVFPSQGDIAFLEMDYKSEVPIFIGIIGFDAFGNQTLSDLTYGTNPRTDWNKVYFNFTDAFSTLRQNNTVTYQIRISAQILIENGEFTMENAEIRLDNIKLITF